VSVEIVGPFNERRLVVNGWQVPFLEATELDGGKVHFTLDHRLGLDVDTKDFEPVAEFLADAIAVALGLPSHPDGDKTLEERERMWALLPHPALSPKRLREITAVSTEPGGTTKGGEGS
jgi:hypothetical protein